MFETLVTIAVFLLIVLTVLAIVLPSIRKIGPTEVGLVTKKFGKKLPGENPIAFNDEAGYQSDLLMPGMRFKLWLIYDVRKFPMVQIPTGEIGVVIAQIGQQLPVGAKSASYKKEFGNFTDLKAFINGNGEKGVQRPVLPPGTILPLHPVAFLVVTARTVFGLPISEELKSSEGNLSASSFGVNTESLHVVEIAPRDGKDVVGVVRTLEGKPLAPGYMASRFGAFADIQGLEKDEKFDDSKLIETLLGDKNHIHNNYQDFQAFIDNGGEMGLQHDVLRYGAYILNPFLVQVEIVPMLVVNQGEAATIKAYVGLSTEDTSGEGFKFGQLVHPGHRGLWQTPLRTGKYALNPRIYQAEIVPTAILNLNWANATSDAHNLDKGLQPIVAKSKEGFVFSIDLQVQIHVPDTKAPKVISMVGSMKNLVNEVLQAAVGNHFRDKLQSMPAIEFIEKRQNIQQLATEHIKKNLEAYEVETRGVYIQDVVLPDELVKVLTEREIANQQIETLKKQQQAEEQRVNMMQAKGTADMQKELAQSTVGIEIQKNKAAARIEEGRGEAEYQKAVGEAAGAKIRSEGMAQADSLKAQKDAIGTEQTTLVNVIRELVKLQLPQIVTLGDGGALNGLAATLTGFIKNYKS